MVGVGAGVGCDDVVVGIQEAQLGTGIQAGRPTGSGVHFVACTVLTHELPGGVVILTGELLGKLD